MRAKIGVATVALTTCLAIGSAGAATSTLAESGAWKAFGGTTESDKPVCGVSTSPEDKYFGLKLFSGSETFTIQISVKQWKVSDKAKYPLTMRFDARTPWTATGTGMHFPDGDPGLEYEVKKQELDTFMREFRNSKKMLIQLKQKGLAPLRLDISDVSTLTDRFESCNRDMKK